MSRALRAANYFDRDAGDAAATRLLRPAQVGQLVICLCLINNSWGPVHTWWGWGFGEEDAHEQGWEL